jgi:succinate dehydrogenase/fumarate reductase flavoprotein subunit
MAEVTWDHTVDVVVVGSGAAALAAAVTAAEGDCEVELLEKAPLLGGTSAFSGGMPWIPMNKQMAEYGTEDSREAVLEYLATLDLGRYVDQELIETFVDRAAEAIEHLESTTPLAYQVCRTYSDYYRDHAGGRPGGRARDRRPVQARAELGEWHDRVRDTPHIPNLTQDEMNEAGTMRNLTVDEAGKVAGEIEGLLAERSEKGIRTLGPAMIARLVKGALDHGVSLRTDTPVRRLVTDGEGAVVGVVAEVEGEEIAIGAARGVVLSCGGFEWNPDLVLAFMGVPDVIALSPPHNTGDGLIMGMEIGAKVANMTNAVAFPSTYDEHSTFEGHPLGMLAGPRAEAGVVIVNREGRRFVNEGVSYMDVAKVHRHYDPQTQTYPNEGPVWQIFDQAIADHAVVGDFRPDLPTPEWVHKASSIAELAGMIGVDPDVLVGEIDRFNDHVEKGVDPEFGRGTVWWEGMTDGGPSPEKNLAKVERGPFYAMKLWNGVLGTVGGLQIDSEARVRRMRGGVIPGLYAAGNTAAGIFGQAYPGGGCTLGPAMTFGYLAGRSLSASDQRPLEEGEVLATTQG